MNNEQTRLQTAERMRVINSANTAAATLAAFGFEHIVIGIYGHYVSIEAYSDDESEAMLAYSVMKSALPDEIEPEVNDMTDSEPRYWLTRAKIVYAYEIDEV